MIEINEVMQLDAKKNIRFDLLPAVNAIAYTCSDAVNTFALFKHMVIDDKDGRNPYKYQNLVTRVMMAAVYMTVSSISYGMPVDYDFLYNRLKTIIIREIIIERKFREISNKYGFGDISLSSPLVGNLLVKIIKNKWDGDEDNLISMLDDKFGMKRKITKLKSGKIKEDIPSNDSVINSLRNGVHDLKFLDDESIRDIIFILDMLETYRTLDKDRAIYLSMFFSARKDDRNQYVVPIGLKIAGTDTLRYANNKGNGAYNYWLSVKKLKTKDKPVLNSGNGVTPSLNAQGMPSNNMYIEKLKKADKITDKMKEIEIEADNIIKEMVVSFGLKS